MDGDTTRARLAERTSGGQLDELRTQIDLTRVTGQAVGVPDIEAQIKAALRWSLTGASSPAEALQLLRSRWVT